MKRFVLIILLLSGMTVEVGAQSIHFSAYGGITFATARYQSDFPLQFMQFDRHQVRTSNFGLNAEMPVNRWLSLRVGLGYLQNGFSVKYYHIIVPLETESKPNPFSGSNPEGTSDYVFHSLQVGGKLKMHPFKRGSPYIFTGPDLRYVMSTKYHAGYLSSIVGPEVCPLVTDNKSLTQGALQPYIEISYLLGLTDMVKSS